MDFAPVIKEIGRGARGARSLSRAQAADVFGSILDGAVPELQLGALLLAWRIKGESSEEMLGFCDAMDARCARLTPPDGPRLVLLPSFNGARKQANLMPFVALALAREGIPVLVHGRHDFTSRENPFELFGALGITPAPDLPHAEQQLRTRRLALLDTVQLLPGLDATMSLRVRLGVRNSAHSAAKLLDPAPGRSVRVVAVTHPDYVERMSEVLPSLCQSKQGAALLMKACEGEAHAHPRRKAQLLCVFPDGSQQQHEAPEAPEQTLFEDADIVANARLVEALLAGDVALPLRISEQLMALQTLASA